MSLHQAISGLLPHFAAGVLFVVFSVSLFHKVVARDEFAGIMADYRILPQRLLFAGYLFVVGAESALFVGLPFAPLRAFAFALSALLLALYGSAIAVNLVRGRSAISCGCGGGGESIAWWMVMRNGALAALAIGCLFLEGGALIPASAGFAGFVLGMTATVLGSAAISLARSAALQAPFANGRAGARR